MHLRPAGLDALPRGMGILVGVPLLALVACSCSPSPEAGTEAAEAVPVSRARAEESGGPIRLLERAGEARVSWPRFDQNTTAPGAFRPLGEARVGRVAMLIGAAREAKYKPDDRMSWGDSRLALLAPAGTRYRFSLRAPAQAQLRVGLGHACSEHGAGLPASIRYRVAIGVPGADEQESVLDEIVAARCDVDWRDVEIDLERWSGRRVDLIFTTALVDAATDGPTRTAWAAWSAPELIGPKQPETGYDVILISLDTLRADHLGCYGYGRATSPNLDAFAAEGIRFAAAVSQAPWTQPSHESILSGFHPRNPDRASWPRLPEALREAGYRTAALTGGGLMDFRMPAMDFARGFESYRLAHWIRDPEGLRSWLASTSGRRRFLFLHTYEIHGPHDHAEFTKPGTGGRVATYWSRPKQRRRKIRNFRPNERAYFMDLYDSAIAYTDRQLAFLFDELRRSGDLDRSIVIVTSDHGEQFWEHGGALHGGVLYDHQLLVPLIVRLPPALAQSLGGKQALAGRVIEQQVRLVDLYPTVLDLLGIPLRHEINGRSLRPLLQGATLPPADALAEYINDIRREDDALRTPRYKLIRVFPRTSRGDHDAQPRVQLFDLKSDPREQIDIAKREPELVAGLLRRLFTLRGDRDAARAAGDGRTPDPLDFDRGEMDRDLEQRLRALGYISE